MVFAPEPPVPAGAKPAWLFKSKPKSKKKRWKLKNDLPEFGVPVGPWIKMFAWWPRFTFDGGRVCLRFIWKRHIYKHQYLDGGPDYWWQYRRFAP